jgi:hypothetical protein
MVAHPLTQESEMADDERDKRSLRAKWRERREHRAERAAQAAERRARLKQARSSADEHAARSGSTMSGPPPSF